MLRKEFLFRGELAGFDAKDGVGLDGFYLDGKGKKAILHVHGMTDNFTSIFHICGEMLHSFMQNHIGLFAINTRGHDIGSIMYKKEKKQVRGKGRVKPVLAGTAYEVFEDCISDIEAAIDFLERQGVQQVYLQGHSTGCQKVTYYQALKRDKRVAGLILLAPVDDYNWIKKFTGERFEEGKQLAKRLISEGKSNELMPGWCHDVPASAQRYDSLVNEKRVEGQIFNYALPQLQYFNEVHVPALAVFGSKEEFAVIEPKKMLAILRDNAQGDYESLLIHGANHDFDGYEQKVAEKVLGWVMGKDRKREY